MADDPSQEELLALHDRLDSDPTAQGRLAELLLRALRRRFASRRDIEWEEIESLIGQSITNYLRRPDRYDPAKGPLLAYLYQDVRGDILNEVAKRSRKPEQSVDEDGLELGVTERNPSMEDEIVDRLDALDLPRWLVDAALTEIERLSAEDREFLCLRASGVRSAQAYAEVLGIAHLPATQQRREVKRAKDRLDKRLRSIRGRLGG